MRRADPKCMFSKEDGLLLDDNQDRDLIALMNETNDFEELETLTRMARARLRSRDGKRMSSSEATSRLRRALSFSLGS